MGTVTGLSLPVDHAAGIADAVLRFREPTHVFAGPGGRRGVGLGERFEPDSDAGWVRLAFLPGLYPEWLGDRSFGERHGTRYPYIAGEMANGIATVELVIAAAQAGGIGFFGAAGLNPDRVAAGIDRLRGALGTALPWGANLIHSPNEPAVERAVADLFVDQGVPAVSASAFMGLTPAVVRCAYAGVRADADGRAVRARSFLAKISRPEVARQFMEPAPAEILEQLYGEGRLTSEEVRLAATLPVAEDITVESDSGGHTDNRPLGALLPTIMMLRDEIASERRYATPIRVGAAGGLGAPAALASAFGLGAAYVLTGSINQACVEAGLSQRGREMLAEAGVADVMMAPAADMFELGVDVQVLGRGTMFAVRGRKLRTLYRSHRALEELPVAERDWLEQQVLRATIAEAWASTRAFWSERDPAQVLRAESDPHHRMALVFRSYLGQASQWAIAGQADRAVDYQIWCGPAMGAFNAWTRGTFLASAAARTVGQVAANLMEGAAAVTRAHQLRTYGVPVPASAFDFRPRPLR